MRSSAPDNPTSCTRTTSISGLRRKRLRMMRPLKFSSARSRTIVLISGRAAGEQPVADTVWIKTGFHLVAHVLTCSLLLGEIRFYRLALTQIKRDDRINVHETQDRVVMRDLFGRGPLGKRRNNRIECDACVCHAEGPLRVSV